MTDGREHRDFKLNLEKINFGSLGFPVVWGELSFRTE